MSVPVFVGAYTAEKANPYRNVATPAVDVADAVGIEHPACSYCAAGHPVEAFAENLLGASSTKQRQKEVNGCEKT